MGIALIQAQPDRAKIAELKRAFFNEKLQMTSDQSVKFWKVYDKYDAERQSLRRTWNKPSQEDFTKLSDQQIYQYIDNSFLQKEKEIALQKKYINELKPILPANKLVKVLRLEEQFRQFLFRQVQHRR